ncbi:hypothetical protein [Mesorhizobium sp. ESP-6-2]|uniref:hypothetical protein n=1 Tax=Mesorhizobium sp. ESP-6-2 TaxID=2876625 RepID=UPI001CCF8544|nr:hypothetical protein [Mesorhizobium sp. ESP-6-2]MBZ9810718.1 hypothetical protein [Mesorhizobium sp. ESP-6-2]
MGSAKEYWMMTRPDHEVSFRCPDCGHLAAAHVRVPSVDEGSRDSVSDERVEEIECLNCDSSWTLEMCADNKGLRLELFGYPAVDISASPLDISDDNWDDDPPPEPDAHSIFDNALQEWRVLLGTFSDEKDGDASENRMLFTHLFSIVEAYLSDAIISLAMADTKVQARMIKVLPILKDKTVSLETIAGNPNIVRDMVRSALQDVSFHNLINVDKICGVALGKPLLPDLKDDRDLLVASIQMRHDCVHRNGRDKSGKRHDIITNTYLAKLGKLFKQMATDLDARILHMNIERNFEDPDQRAELFPTSPI